MRTIWKYRLPLENGGDYRFELSMPSGALLLDVQLQNERPTLWALVDADDVMREARRFAVVFTGAEVPSDEGTDALYVGTWQQGWLVCHLFQLLDHDLFQLKERKDPLTEKR
jgi:hypothetical protein